MHPIRHTAQLFMSGIFVAGGFDAALNPKSKVAMAENLLPQEIKAFGHTVPSETVIRANGIAQMMGGTLLAGNANSRLAATILVGSLVPTTLAGHRFWEEEGEPDRARQRIQFLKNLAIIGGLLMIIVDRVKSE